MDEHKKPISLHENYIIEYVDIMDIWFPQNTYIAPLSKIELMLKELENEEQNSKSEKE